MHPLLQLILPTTGLYCVVSITPNATGGKSIVRHHWFDTLDAMAAGVDSIDTTQAVDWYFACATFAEHKRTQKAVTAVRAFWVDIDFKDSPYDDVKQAASAVIMFCRDVGVPPPTFVRSGGGLHAYWPLDINLPLASWRKYADGLKRLAAERGLGIDAKCTGDGARIMRLPGTLNYKYSPARECKVISAVVQPYPIEQFAVFAASAGANVHKARKPSGGVGSAETPAASTDVRARATIDADASATTIASVCEQLRLLRDAGSAFSEPHWYACANVLKHCRDGRECWHEWSAIDPRYNADEADAKFMHAIGSGTGPATCAQFAGLHPDGCAGCRFNGRITTPLQTANHVDTQTVVREHAEQAPPETVMYEDGSTEILPPRPNTFMLNAEGSLCQIVQAAGGSQLVLVANGDVRLIDIRESNRNKTFVFHLIEKRATQPKEIHVPANVAMSRDAGAAMGSYGIYVYEGALWRAFIRDSVELVTSMKDKSKLYEHFGWQEDGTFLMGRRLYYPATETEPMGCKRVHVASGLEQRANLFTLKPTASFKEAAVCIEQTFSQATPGQIGHFFTAMGGVLTAMTGNAEGGVSTWNYSKESGTGKSVMTSLIELMYGEHKCLRISENDTVNASAVFFSQMHSLPVTIDDPKPGDGSIFRALIQRFVVGQDKMALNRNREMRDHPGSWCTTLAGAGNFAANDFLLDQTKRRVLSHREEPRKMDKSRWNGVEGIFARLQRHSGVVMHEIMKRLMGPRREAVRARLQRWIDTINTQYQFETQDRFVVSGIAQAMTMAELFTLVATEENAVVTFDRAQMLKALVSAAKESMRIADENNGGSASDILDAFVNAMNSNTARIYARNEVDDTPTIRTVDLRALKELTIIADMRHGLLYIHRATLNAWLQERGHSQSAIYGALATAGMIVKETDVFNAAARFKVGLPDVGKQRYITIRRQ